MIGTTLTHYRITAKLGEGGMGEVYRATDTKLGREVAIKVLPASFSRDAQSLARFEREAKALAALNHPHIAGIHGFEADQGTHFLVLELVEGETLAERLRRGPLPVKEALTVARQMAEAIQEAHEKGIIHRDLKPGNVKLTPNGRVKVLDFGLAKMEQTLRGDAEPANDPEAPTMRDDTTLAGTVMGTPAYMSPEQALGRPVDHRSDLFSFGVVLYQLLTGRCPFAGSSLGETINRILNTEPDPIPPSNAAVPVELTRIVRKCLEKEANRRYQSAQDLLVDLRNLKRELETSAGKPHGQTAAVSSSPKSVAVLPFVNMSSDRENEYLSDGVTEDIINALSQISGLRVQSRTSAFAFKGLNEDIQRIGAKLDVGTILEGSVRKIGNKIRVSAQLINVADGFLIWSERYDREMGDIFAVQDEISRAIASALHVRWSVAAEEQLARHFTGNPDAYKLYLQGRYYWNHRGTGLKKALHYFELALVEDPGYARAHTGVADTYNLLAFYSYLPVRDAIPYAERAARKALAIDATLPEAHAALGSALLFGSWDSPGAEREFQCAIKLNPNYVPARYYYANLLSATSRPLDAVREDQEAVRIEPLSKFASTHLGWVHIFARQFDRAIAELNRALHLDPQFFLAHCYLGQAHLAKANWEAALPSLRQAVTLSQRNTWMLGTLGVGLALAGQPAEALQIAAELQDSSKHTCIRYDLLAAINSATSGAPEQTFAWLEQAFSDRNSLLLWANTYFVFDNLRNDPRFSQLIQKMGIGC